MRSISKINCLFYLFIMLLMGSCAEIQDPTVREIENVDVVTMNKSLVEVNADMVIYNPNGFALDLDRADLLAFIDDVEVATINQTYEASMPPRDTFHMPVFIRMDLDKLYNENPLAAIGKSVEILSKRSVEVSLKGSIHAGKGFAKVSVPVDRKEEVKF